ncbi:MAG: cytochrome c oxidase assembly protein [Gammaproteobacteria bacterium]|nr:cytochrome c oxidase assembly protein [Gammaproteobacteria bacterium]
MDHNSQQAAHRSLSFRLIGLAAGMFAFGFLMVPLYDIFCEVTGIGGKFDTTAAIVENTVPVNDRTITVEFVASLNEYAPWEFRPAVASMEVQPGEVYDTTFFARNLTERDLVGQAVPDIAPGQAVKYFQKTECFCFTSQSFTAQESKDMPLTFIIDPDLPEHIDRLTLSYTFFVSKQVAQIAD